MADYFLDDAANGTNNGASWETCYNTWAQVNAASILTAANRLIVGADANITDPGANLTITGPTSGAPTVIISSTVGTGTAVAYSVGTGLQVNTSSGAYTLTFDGSFALYGIKAKAGARLVLGNDANETMYAEDCRFVLAAASDIYLGSLVPTTVLKNCVIDLTADSGNTSNSPIVGTAGRHEIQGLTFVIPTPYRQGAIISMAGIISVSGADFSGFTNATLCEWSNANGLYRFNNCKSASTWSPSVAAAQSQDECLAVNCGPSDDPSYLFHQTYQGKSVSSTTIYRSSGATVEDVTGVSWLITTTAACSEGAPYYTPWIYGTVDSTGSKTFDLYITNDTADFDDSQAWLEIEAMGTSDSPLYSLGSDHRSNSTGAFVSITEPADAQADDTTSTWTDNDGSISPSFTYKQKLSVTATVNETGLYRARVACGVASIASSRYFYVDPLVTVT